MDDVLAYNKGKARPRITTFVASNPPPRPTSRIATSTYNQPSFALASQI